MHLIHLAYFQSVVAVRANISSSIHSHIWHCIDTDPLRGLLCHYSWFHECPRHHLIQGYSFQTRWFQVTMTNTWLSVRSSVVLFIFVMMGKTLSSCCVFVVVLAWLFFGVTFLFVCCLSVCLSVYLSVYLSSYLRFVCYIFIVALLVYFSKSSGFGKRFLCWHNVDRGNFHIFHRKLLDRKMNRSPT